MVRPIFSKSRLVHETGAAFSNTRIGGFAHQKNLIEPVYGLTSVLSQYILKEIKVFYGFRAFPAYQGRI